MPSITTIDTFTHASVTYNINYISSGSFSVEPPLNEDISELDRGHYNGDPIGTQNIGGHVIDFFASLSSPYATATIATPGGGTPDIPGCDLAIKAVNPTNQTSPGANNGGVSVSATSSGGAIQYSINNTSWQTGNVFTGLPSGAGTVYVQDAAGCTTSGTYTIGTNAVVLDRLVVTPALNGSRWSALFNPIVFGYQSAVHLPGRKFITKITSGYDGQTQSITATHAANLKGYCRADISKYLRTLLQPRDELDYTAINYRDANSSASYTVQYKEVWDGGQDNTWTSAGDPFYITYSAMQIGNKTGGNMAPFVTFPDAVQPAPARFLNDFKYPVYYPAMPWDISFIYSEKVVGYQLKLGGNGIDINGNICGSLGETMLLNEDGSVLLNEDGSKLLIEKQAPGVLLSKLGVNRLRVTQNLPAHAIWLDVFLYYTNAGVNIPVTENRRLLISNAPCNGEAWEYLKWMGPTGGWLYYLFTKNQTHELATGNAILMENHISDYAAADSSHQLISISAQRKITVTKTDVPAHEAEALATLLYSPKVYRLVDAATNTWQGVIIDTNSIKMYQTYGNTGDFELSFLLPEINTQKG